MSETSQHSVASADVPAAVENVAPEKRTYSIKLPRNRADHDGGLIGRDERQAL